MKPLWICIILPVQTSGGITMVEEMESPGLEGNELPGMIKEQLSELPDRLQMMGLGWNIFLVRAKRIARFLAAENDLSER